MAKRTSFPTLTDLWGVEPAPKKQNLQNDDRASSLDIADETYNESSETSIGMLCISLL